ncbi:deoxyribodipyrimidine photo-lyase, partial [Paraburkholderia sp. SIMBA_027]|uniref:deoxyribodipyrimidine photo-lyase n=1 Tax=Paraburkholderia sp. SIMBA_027 TaxID=3085770 RepID=UPI00397D1F3C
LEALDRSLQKHHSKLVLLSGNALDVLHALIKSTGAETVLWNRRYDPAGMATDKALKQTLRDDGLTVQSFAGHLLHEPSRVQTKSGGPYRVYTPFWR